MGPKSHCSLLAYKRMKRAATHLFKRQSNLRPPEQDIGARTRPQGQQGRVNPWESPGGGGGGGGGGQAWN